MVESTVINPSEKPQIDIKFEMGTDELVAIAVSREETRLKQQLDQLGKHIRSVVQTRNKRTGELEEIALKHFKTSYSESADLFIDALESLDIFTSERFTLSSFNSYLLKSDAPTVYVGTLGLIDKESNVIFSRCLNVQAPSAMETLRREIWTLDEEIEEMQNQKLELRRSLSELDTLERRARASVATSMLKGTKLGEKFLASIGGIKSLTTSLEI